MVVRMTSTCPGPITPAVTFSAVAGSGAGTGAPVGDTEVARARAWRARRSASLESTRTWSVSSREVERYPDSPTASETSNAVSAR